MSSDEPGSGFMIVESNAEAAGREGQGGGVSIDFSTFVLSLGTSAIYHLGQIQSGEEPNEPNLPAARQTIDTLEMLQEKTRGNLDPDEVKLLESILYELHIRFAKAGR